MYHTSAVPAGLVRVAMVYVGIVFVSMPHRLMLVRVHVRINAIPFEVMRVLVVRVVTVAMAVLQRFMLMFVLVRFGQVQPDTCAHQRSGAPE